MVSDKVNTILRHQGAINGPIITELLDDIDFKCINKDMSDAKRKKIFNLAVEMYQNLYHYTRDLNIDQYDPSEIRMVMLSIEEDEDEYHLVTQNYIKNSDIHSLTKKIDYLNKLEGTELRAYYREILKNEQFSEKGGAGLGLIDMKKRSCLPLEYQIVRIDENISKFILTVKVKK